MELRTCPFCGGEAEMMRTNDNQSRPFVRCKFGTMLTPKCPASRIWMWDYYNGEEEAAEAWNRRATDGEAR